MRLGDHVVYVDGYSRAHQALVTAIWGDVINPLCINLVFVSDDENRKDDYGRQIERQTSVVHVSNQAAPGNYWCYDSEYDHERDIKFRIKQDEVHT